MEDTSPRLGCYGDRVARTPHIDRLAGGGCRYDRAFATAGVCAPSRSSIITGMYPTAIGTQHMRTTHENPATPELPTPYCAVPPPHVKMFTEYLRGAGWYCSNNDKTDYQFEPPVTGWDACGKDAHWRSRRPGQPFFAVFNLDWTHESGMWPVEGESVVTDPATVDLPPFLPGTPKCRLALARHYDNIARDDERIGELLAELEADGLADDTLVVLWSDHGEGLPRCKRWPYDGGIRVPLIVRWPGKIAPGSVSDQLVSLIDLAPTMLSLAGVPVPRHLHGQPFLGPDTEPRETIFATRDRYDESYDLVRAVRDSRYKYLRHGYPQAPYLQWIPYRNRHPIMEELWRLHAADELDGDPAALFRDRPSEELYDTESDPFELHNLAADPGVRSTLDRLRRELDEWEASYDPMGGIPEDQMLRQMWPDGTRPITAPVTFVPINEDHPGRDVTPAGGAFAGPTLLQLHCPTQGASITYCTEASGEGWWQLYTRPLRLPEGTTRVRTKAARIGYAVSEERGADFTINPPCPARSETPLWNGSADQSPRSPTTN